MIPAFSQDAAWKKLDFDGYMTVMMPQETKRIDSTIEGIRDFNVEIHKSTEPFVFAAFKSDMPVFERADTEMEKEEKIKALMDYFTVKAMKAKQFLTYKDTIIDNVKCQKIDLIPAIDAGGVVMAIYVAFIGGKVYGIAYDNIDKDYEPYFKKILAGLHFTVAAAKKEEYKKYTGVSKRELLITLGITVVVVVILIVMREMGKQQKKKKTNRPKFQA